jgi:hypothetical protein
MKAPKPSRKRKIREDDIMGDAEDCNFTGIAAEVVPTDISTEPDDMSMAVDPKFSDPKFSDLAVEDAVAEDTPGDFAAGDPLMNFLSGYTSPRFEAVGSASVRDSSKDVMVQGALMNIAAEDAPENFMEEEDAYVNFTPEEDAYVNFTPEDSSSGFEAGNSGSVTDSSKDVTVEDAPADIVVEDAPESVTEEDAYVNFTPEDSSSGVEAEDSESVTGSSKDVVAEVGVTGVSSIQGGLEAMGVSVKKVKKRGTYSFRTGTLSRPSDVGSKSRM